MPNVFIFACMGSNCENSILVACWHKTVNDFSVKNYKISKVKYLNSKDIIQKYCFRFGRKNRVDLKLAGMSKPEHSM